MSELKIKSVFTFYLQVYDEGHGGYDYSDEDFNEDTRWVKLSDAEEAIESFKVEFVDWFGTWHEDKNLKDYGVNDVVEEFEKSKKN